VAGWVAQTGQPAIVTLQDFKWNLDLDPKLFDTTPPEGYADVTAEPPTLAEQVNRVIKGLEIYRELSGGRYPGGTMVYGDVTRDEMFKMVGIEGRPTREQIGSQAYANIMQAGLGLGTINRILTDNADAAYHGKIVGPQNADKVLLRWRLDDGRYQIIYGDLRREVVDGERLRAVERK